MDSLITAAARALAAGDALGALKRVALRDVQPALALRGIAMAQLGDLVRAKALLKSAARAFGPREAMARARCVVAEAEIALVSRDLTWPPKALEAARKVLEAHGDRVNAAHARNVELRLLVLIGLLRRGRAGAGNARSNAVAAAWQGPLMSWWSRASRSGACRRIRRTRLSTGRGGLHARPVCRY